MKLRMKLLSAVIVFSMVIPLFTGILRPVFAADIPIEIKVDSYEKSTGTVNFHWTAIPNVVSGTIEYHVPNGKSYDTIRVTTDPAKNSASITNIKSDIIYDFNIMLTDKAGQTFVGKQYFLPQISFYSQQVDQQYVSVPGGGVESGVFPSLKLTWNMPKVFNPSTNTEEYAFQALSLIDGNISKMNFSINLSTSKKDLSNLDLPSILVTQQMDGSYAARVSGDTDAARTSKVKWDPTNGQLSMYVLGVKDDTTLLPSMDVIRNPVTAPDVLPQEITNAGDNSYVLPHSGILPGTVYKMNMDSSFVNSLDQYIGTVANGLTESPLVGSTDYTYTPIRFQLTKDSFDNVYVRIYTINQGGVNMPKLYYEVQTSKTPSNQDTSWTMRKQLGGFKGEYGLTVISGISSQNTVYYRVVVKSNSVSDRIMSLMLPYTMQDDTSRPPVPKNVAVTNVNLAMPTASSGITDKSSNITITWDKPSNWDQIKGNLSNDIYFHFLININSKDLDLNPIPMLTANGKNYGLFEVKYRLVKFVSANSSKIIDLGTKLSYTIEGFSLFKGEDENGASINIPNDNYPTYFLPNKTYYVQMYTTNASNRGTTDATKMSDRSVIVSFTTLSPDSRDIPIPKKIECVETTASAVTLTNPANATIKLRFDDVDIDWDKYTSQHVSGDDGDKVFYDLYMSDSPDISTFTHIIGSSDPTIPGDVAFIKEPLGNITWVNATINKFVNSTANVSAFGYSLAPNTTYYFALKVRLKMINDGTRSSQLTSILSVTTPSGKEPTPDDTAQRPNAPIDFGIALDANGNPMISGQSVTFEWTATQSAVVYNLVCTTNKVEPNTSATSSAITTDETFLSFISNFGSKDYDARDQELTLNPNVSPMAPNFEYNSATKKCRYTINTWLYPNKVYYFSLRSTLTDAKGTKSSVWVSIPVTTSLIDSPTKLQVVNDCETEFYWFDQTPNITADNFKIMVKSPSDNDYITLPKSQYTITKSGSVYYARVLRLKENSLYKIRVIRTIGTTEATILNDYSKYTRDTYSQIDLRWQGFAIDPYSGYEIAIKSEDDTDYTILNNDTDLEQYTDISTHTYPYYIEKDIGTVNTSNFIYNARIKLMPTKLANGTIDHLPLKSNTKYYIKVRAYKKDSSNATAITPSKYAGPVDTRTEFNQGEYDDTDNNTGVTASFLDQIDKLEQGLYWQINNGNSVANKVLVKDDRIINILEGSGVFSCLLDLSETTSTTNTDDIYLSQNILKAMKKNDRSIIIKTKGAQYTIRPDTFDVGSMEAFKSISSKTGTQDVYLRINNTESTSVQPVPPANTTAASKMELLTAQVIASSQASSEVGKSIKDKLYDSKTGLVQKKVKAINNGNNQNTRGTAQEKASYIDKLVTEVSNELSYYIEEKLFGVGITGGVLGDRNSITSFNSPLGVRMQFNSGGIANPYVAYGNTTSWQKVSKNLKFENGYLSFFATATGKYAIFTSKDLADTVDKDNPAKAYISELSSKYDLTSVFPDADKSFNSQLAVTVKEGILLYKLLMADDGSAGTDTKQIAKQYGLDKIINISNINRNLSRQEAGALVIKMYCQKTGADYTKLRMNYNKTVNDDSSISAKYWAPVYSCLSMDIFTLDSDGNFNPDNEINRADVVTAFQKMLDLTDKL